MSKSQNWASEFTNFIKQNIYSKVHLLIAFYLLEI